MDLQHYLADVGMKTMSRVHRAIVHLSSGQILGSAFGMPVVELHTVGGTRAVRARPCLPRRSSTVTGASGWPPRAAMTVMVAAYHGYGSYQGRTDHDLPLVICEPR